MKHIPIDHTQLPEGSVLRLYQVDDYYVQIGYVQTSSGERNQDGVPLPMRDAEGTRSRGVAFSSCTCPEGFTNTALSIAGIKRICCEHAAQVLAEASRVV